MKPNHKEWDIKRCALDSPELKKALQDNYEPFAVKYSIADYGRVYSVWLKKNITVEED